jgi:GST-like protein
MIDFYAANTPNGQKIAIALEEFGLPYTLHRVDLGKDEQKSPEYLKLNPNGKIPTIVDRENHDFVVFESGAILIYLADLTRRFLPELGRGRSVAIQWLMFQMGGIGPMAGQAGYFVKRAPERIPHAIERYQREVRRLFEVMDTRLGQAKFLFGDDYTIADMATWPWVNARSFYEVPADGLPHLERWIATVGARPAVQKGMAVLKG